jgi:hypothetical protein
MCTRQAAALQQQQSASDSTVHNHRQQQVTVAWCSASIAAWAEKLSI